MHYSFEAGLPISFLVYVVHYLVILYCIIFQLLCALWLLYILLSTALCYSVRPTSFKDYHICSCLIFIQTVGCLYLCVLYVPGCESVMRSQDHSLSFEVSSCNIWMLLAKECEDLHTFYLLSSENAVYYLLFLLYCYSLLLAFGMICCSLGLSLNRPWPWSCCSIIWVLSFWSCLHQWCTYH